MEKVNWKILNAALWFEIVLAYFLPFDSMHVNPIGFLIDVLIIYLVILLCVKGYQKWKCRFWRKRQ